MLLPAVYRICSLQKPAAVAPVHAVVALLVLLTQLFGYTVPGSALVMLVLLALANAAKVVVNAAGLLEGTLPLSTPLDIDNATIDRAFESAKLQVVKHLGTLRKVLRMDDIVLSVRTVAVILVAASADWVLCVPVLAFFWIVATGLCVADTQARDMVRWLRLLRFACLRAGGWGDAMQRRGKAQVSRFPEPVRSLRALSAAAPRFAAGVAAASSWLRCVCCSPL